MRRLEPVGDASSAAGAKPAISGRRRLNEDMAGKRMLVATRKALRVAASLDI